MHPDTALTWSWLNVLTKKRYDVVKEVYGDLDEAIKHIGETFLKSLGCREETVFKILLRFEEFSVDAYRAELARCGIVLISLEDAMYPSRLREIPDAPIFLYFRGDVSILEQPCIALVGTRHMSTYGRRVTERFVPQLTQAGLVTVSGLAQGIDTVVAEETLRVSGRTVAVLGHGFGVRISKSSDVLAERIVEGGGLILTEFPLDQPPDKHTFPARNRIIAALSLGTVVLEAPMGSGALITADLALDYGREVFAVPGQVFDGNYEGSHQFIAQGRARLVVGSEDVLQELGIVVRKGVEKVASCSVSQNSEEDALLRVLSALPQHTDVLVERAHLAMEKVNTTLTMMELRGVVRNVGQGMWVRC